MHQSHKHVKKIIPYIFVCALFFVMVSGELLTRGMFMDGLIYSSVAKNLSQGVGSFWHLTYTATHFVDFYEHPPLMIFLLGLWFKIFGTSMLAAKGYALLIAGLNAVMVVAVWCRLGFKRETGWLPLLLMLLIPIVPQSVCDNYLECTMSVFVLIAVWCLLYERGCLYLVASALWLRSLQKDSRDFFHWRCLLLYGYSRLGNTSSCEWFWTRLLCC